MIAAAPVFGRGLFFINVLQRTNLHYAARAISGFRLCVLTKQKPAMGGRKGEREKDVFLFGFV